MTNWEVAMGSVCTTSDLSGEVGEDQIRQNICTVLAEIRGLEIQSKASLRTIPSYRVLHQVNLDEVFLLYGLKKSVLYRLTQSPYMHDLSQVVVFYGNGLSIDHIDEPAIIGDKLFISHDFFKKWIGGSSHDSCEQALLAMINQNSDTRSFVKN